MNDIHFAEKDPEVIKSGIINDYELSYYTEAGERVTLYRGDPRRLLLLTIADIVIQQRNLIDYTGKQNTLAFASEDRLDHLGLLLDVHRLQAQFAMTTMRFVLSAPQPAATVIPAGTRVTPGGGNVYFATATALEIPAGETEGLVSARCTAPGSAANGFLEGQINRLVDPLPFVQSVANVTASAGGSDIEDDEGLRERIHIAPEKFSMGGPTFAYKYWAITAHQGIGDVSVLGPEDDPPTQPGHVELYPLMKNGEIPTQDILDLVYEICNGAKIRPDTDFVHVLAPVPVPFDLSVTYWIERQNATQAAAIRTAVEQAVEDWTLWQRSALGLDLNPSKLTSRMIAAGAKRTEISTPAFQVLNKTQVAVVRNKEILYGGLEDG